ncbi:MAG TPA: hypothetical protein VN864_01410 [Thermoplasmata archaeon]|nr:hypothetical protein [Thermoplasmata archaeon]
MTLRRTEVELAVERDVADADGIVRRFRIVGRYPVEGASPTPEELAPLLRALSEELDRSLPAGTPVVARADRPLSELVETYRPRQPELLDLLLEDHELTDGEFSLLHRYLVERATPAPVEPVPTDRPIAAAPLAQDRTPITPRPVDELLRLYRIESLKQAGAVRAHRQISYEEYMALKRHFGAAETAAAAAPPS